MEEDKHQFRRMLEEVEREIHQLNDIRTQRLNTMSRWEPDTIQSVEWLVKNKDKFKQQIFEPIITIVNANNAKYSRIVEACVKFKERSAFVAQSVEVSTYIY